MELFKFLCSVVSYIWKKHVPSMKNHMANEIQGSLTAHLEYIIILDNTLFVLYCFNMKNGMMTVRKLK